MDLLATKKQSICAVFVLMLCFSHAANGYNTYLFDNVKTSYHEPHIVTIEGERVRRDTALAPAPLPVAPHLDEHGTGALIANGTVTNQTATALPSTPSTLVGPLQTPLTATVSAAVAPPPAPATTSVASVTQTPLLGQNGTGILRVNTTNVPRVSDPISINDDNITDVLKNELDEAIKTEKNSTSVYIDSHIFYNSTFIGNQSYFDEYWANITKPDSNVHAVLSNSHRRATTLKLSFEFPFYGHPLRNITVATGGFIYTGEHVHNWLAATQYIAPLMANFDTTLTNDSYVKICDDGEKFTAFWEKVPLQEDESKQFTFAVTLYKDGDIVFAYKNIPIAVQNISDNDHPVKVGISDAYLNDRILFLVRRKTIYEYHRVSFKNYEIKSGSVLRLTALPTCLQYTTCDSCLSHDTGFDCMWCDSIRKCSSGTDRNKQDWLLRSCDRTQVSNASSCPAHSDVNGAGDDSSNPSYSTDSQTPLHDTAVNTMTSSADVAKHAGVGAPLQVPVRGEAAPAPHSAVGGVVAAFTALALVAGAAAWALYAFKNPHTRSGQLLIKYRPSQWSWRRGEARYTAATIHM